MAFWTFLDVPAGPRSPLDHEAQGWDQMLSLVAREVSHPKKDFRGFYVSALDVTWNTQQFILGSRRADGI